MDLSNDLLSQFAKLTKNDENTKKEDVVYGTVVVHNDIKYVKLDGSEVLTPVTSTTEIEDQNRVMVMVKNHTAVVTGNISSPSASTDSVKQVSDRVAEFHTIIADKADIDELDAQIARIDSLVAENAVIKGQITASEAEISEIKSDNVTINEKLTANEADIKKLQTDKIDAAVVEADYATIKSLEVTDAKINNLSSTFGDFEVLTTNQFAANKASIDDLETRKLNTSDAEIKYANIDFSNIGKAAIEYFYSTSGLIKNVVVGDQTITGELVGVTIKGDLIEGNTIVADKLVIKGTDGLYYKLNTDGITTEAEQTDYNSLNGSVIRANSITAEKIAVSDLVAFDATIAGFKMTNSSIYSGVKNSSDNTTKGIYLDSDGQFVVGDSDNYIKYYKDETGAYKLAVSAESITFSTGGNVKDSIDDINRKIDTVDSRITQNKNQILSEVSSVYQRQDAMGNYYTIEQANSIIDQRSNSIALSVVSRLNIANTNLYRHGADEVHSDRFFYIETYNILSPYIGKKICVSFDCKIGNNGVSRKLKMYPYQDNGISIGYNTNYTFFYFTPTTTYKRFSFVTKVHDYGIRNESYTKGAIGIYDDSGVNDLYIRHIKIELGEKATEWIPAPGEADYVTTASLGLYVKKDDTNQIKSMIEAIADTINITSRGGFNLSGDRFTLSSTYTNISANGVITTNSTTATGDKMQGTIRGGEFLIKNLTNNSSIFMQGHAIVVNNNDNKEVISLWKRTYNDTVGHGAIEVSNNSGTTTISLFGDTGTIKCNALIPKIYSWGLDSNVITYSTEWDYFRYTYTFKGPGLLIANAAVWTDETYGYGTTVCTMYIDDACVSSNVSSNMYSYDESSNNIELNAGCSFVWYFSDSNTHTLRLKAGSSKEGTKTLTRSIQGLFGLTAV